MYVCHNGCVYTVLQIVRRPGVCSVVYGIVRYEEPLNAFLKIRHIPEFGLPSVAICSRCTIFTCTHQSWAHYICPIRFGCTCSRRLLGCHGNGAVRTVIIRVTCEVTKTTWPVTALVVMVTWLVTVTTRHGNHALPEEYTVILISLHLDDD